MPAVFALVVSAAGCGTAHRPPLTPLPPRWEQHVAPFPVFDADGIPLDLPFLGGFEHPRPQLVDIDADGRVDLFLQEYTGTLMHFVQDGRRDGVPVWRVGSLDFQQLAIGEWYRFADLDGDGDVDLLAEEPFSYIRYFRNDGTPAAPRFTLVADTLRDATGRPMFSDRQNIPQLGDIDCDGVPDLLIGKLDGTVARYEQVDGPWEAPRFELLTDEFEGIRIIGQGGLGGGGTMHGANTMALADHDGDGDPDLFWGDFFEPGLLLIENVGSCAAPNLRSRPVQFPAANPILTSGYNAPTFGDLDSDGRLELVMGVLGGAYNPNLSAVENLYLVRWAGAGWEVRSRRLVRTVDVGSESIPVLVDLEGDGDLDLLVANKLDPDSLHTSRIYHFENVGGVTAPAFRLRGALPFGGQYHFAPAFGDLNGDGRLDLILGQWAAHLSYWEGTADGGFALVDSAFVTITRGSNTTPALGDVDGDGDLDLFVGEASGTLNYYRNDGTPTAPRFALVTDVWENVDLGRRSAPHLVDLDADGDPDLLVGSELEGIRVFRNDRVRGEPVWARVDAAFPFVPLAAPTSGDLDGDGRLEIVVGGAGGGLTFLRP